RPPRRHGPAVREGGFGRSGRDRRVRRSPFLQQSARLSRLPPRGGSARVAPRSARMLDTSHFAVGVLAILVLVFANGFFVASEFALVTVRKTRIDQLIAEGHRGARTVRRVQNDPGRYIAAPPRGLTIARLGPRCGCA